MLARVRTVQASNSLNSRLFLLPYGICNNLTDDWLVQYTLTLLYTDVCLDSDSVLDRTLYDKELLPGTKTDIRAIKTAAAEKRQLSIITVLSCEDLFVSVIQTFVISKNTFLAKNSQMLIWS